MFFAFVSMSNIYIRIKHCVNGNANTKAFNESGAIFYHCI